ncbi:CD40 ligand-like [Arapaima gigas]
MTSDSENHTYTPLGRNSPQTDGGSRKWTVILFVLSLIFGVEVIINALLVYHMSAEINETQKVAGLGEYPLHCLQQLMDPESMENATLSSGGLASCDLWIEEMKNTAQKVARQSVCRGRDDQIIYAESSTTNITLSHSKKPAIHMGPEQELRQFPDLMMKGKESHILKHTFMLMHSLYLCLLWSLENLLGRTDIIRWDNINGPAVQQGLMGYNKDGGIVVSREGIYFVYSQVYFQLLPSAEEKQSKQFFQYIYRKTALYPKPILLSKAGVTKCWNPGMDFQFFSSHQGALFQLQRGDMLSLHVPDIKSVCLQDGSTFFGAFMVN